jgi:hypothetical protein
MELLDELEGEVVRLWTRSSVGIRNSDGISMCLVGRLTVGEDFVIITEPETEGWTAIPIQEIAMVETEDEEDAEIEEKDTPNAGDTTIDRETAFEIYWRELRQRRNDA